MKRSAVLFLVLACILSGCAGKQEETFSAESVQALAVTEPPAEEITEPPTELPTEPPTEPDPVEELLQTMSLEEKVGQLFFARCPEQNGAEDAAQYHLGGYILFGRDFADKTADEVKETIRTYQNHSRIPLLIGVDEEGGIVVRVSANGNLRSSPFQSPQKLYAQGGMERILEDTKEKDALLTDLGINVNFAPVVDVSPDPEDYMYDRALGQDAETTADFAARMINQMAEDNMGSVLKHFPGYGSSADTHTDIAIDERPLETFLEEDMLPFGAFAAGEGKTAILVSHNIITCLDAQLPASLSPRVNGFLRENLCFDGVVMTDGLDMGAVMKYVQDGDIAVTALLAGNDILLTCDYKTGIPAILEAVTDGTVTERMISDACRRVLTWKRSLGLL